MFSFSCINIDILLIHVKFSNNIRILFTMYYIEFVINKTIYKQFKTNKL